MSKSVTKSSEGLISEGLLDRLCTSLDQRYGFEWQSKEEKELLWQSLVPSEELAALMSHCQEIKPETEEGIRYSRLFQAYLEGIGPAIQGLRAMEGADATSLTHLLDSLPEPFRGVVIEELKRKV